MKLVIRLDDNAVKKSAIMLCMSNEQIADDIETLCKCIQNHKEAELDITDDVAEAGVKQILTMTGVCKLIQTFSDEFNQ